MIVLIVVTAVSTIKAQDTLQLQSLRTVDVCSGTSRWLITASLGTIRFGDSLESFDITIGYDRNVLRPTDVLKEGTLSAQMSNGPTMNVIVPGELRIFGFNIARSVAGNLPLVAVAGDFIGRCDDNGSLTIPYPPDFNGEFKKRVTVFTADVVKSVAKAKPNPTAGCRFSSNELQLKAGDEKTSFSVNVEPFSGSSRRRLIELRNVQAADSTIYEIDNVQATSKCNIDSVHSNGLRTRVFVSVDSLDNISPISIEVSVARRAVTEVKTVRIVGTLKNLDSCSCVDPVLTDSISIEISPVVSTVQSSLDEQPCTVSVANDIITGKCDHQRMKTLEVFDLFGKRLREDSEDNTTSVDLSTDSLPNGICIIRMQCGNTQTVKTIVK